MLGPCKEGREEMGLCGLWLIAVALRADKCILLLALWPCGAGYGNHLTHIALGGYIPVTV